MLNGELRQWPYDDVVKYFDIVWDYIQKLIGGGSSIEDVWRRQDQMNFRKYPVGQSQIKSRLIKNLTELGVEAVNMLTTSQLNNLDSILSSAGYPPFGERYIKYVHSIINDIAKSGSIRGEKKMSIVHVYLSDATNKESSIDLYNRIDEVYAKYM